jgi:hypothetical protein
MGDHNAACSCGQLHLTAHGDPARISMCHCLACQRRSGSAFAMQARFPASRVRVVGRFTEYTRLDFARWTFLRAGVRIGSGGWSGSSDAAARPTCRSTGQASHHRTSAFASHADQSRTQAPAARYSTSRYERNEVGDQQPALSPLQPAQPNVRLRRRLLVHSDGSRSRRQVVVSRSCLRPPPQGAVALA